MHHTNILSIDVSDLPSEAEIVSAWGEYIDKPKVSIICTAYNHESYIEDAIRGFLLQKTNFPFEILVHDDASKDNTQELIKFYEHIYPSLLTGIYQVENQWSKGVKPGDILYQYAKGEYIALCEGDDYWQDRLKLSKQIKALDQRRDVNIAIHPAQLVNQRTGASRAIGRYREEDGMVPIAEIVAKKHGRIPTASTVVRKEIYGKLRDFRWANPYITVGDIYLHILGAESAGAWYSNFEGSVYRHFSNESWTTTQNVSAQARIRHAQARIDSFLVLDKLMERRHHSSFIAANRDELRKVCQDDGISVPNRLRFYNKYRSLLSLRGKFSLLLYALMPGHLLIKARKLKGLI